MLDSDSSESGPVGPSAEALKASWQPHPRCPDYALEQLRTLVASFPAPWFPPLCKGDKFESLADALARLQGFTVTQGFAVTNISGSLESLHPYFVVACLHYGKATRNWRKLEDHIERDETSKVTTRRQQEDTSVQAKNCKFAWAISYKQVPRGSGSYQFVVTKCPPSAHSHELAVNPLRYKVIEKMTSHYSTAV